MAIFSVHDVISSAQPVNNNPPPPLAPPWPRSKMHPFVAKALSAGRATICSSAKKQRPRSAVCVQTAPRRSGPRTPARRALAGTSPCPDHRSATLAPRASTERAPAASWRLRPAREEEGGWECVAKGDFACHSTCSDHVTSPSPHPPRFCVIHRLQIYLIFEYAVCAQYRVTKKKESIAFRFFF